MPETSPTALQKLEINLKLEIKIDQLMAELAALARTQYTLGYYSHVPVMDGRFRTIDVRVLRPNVDVIAEKGYYPTATNLSR